MAVNLLYDNGYQMIAPYQTPVSNFAQLTDLVLSCPVSKNMQI